MESESTEVTESGSPSTVENVKTTTSEDFVERVENAEAPPVLLPETELVHDEVIRKVVDQCLESHHPEEDSERPKTSLQSVKLTILERKRRAVKIRQALSRNSKMLRIQRWQKSVSTSGIISESEEGNIEPQRKRTRSDTCAAPILQPSAYNAEGPDEGREMCMRPPVLRKQSSSASSGTNNSEHAEDNDEEGEQGTDSDVGSGSQRARKMSSEVGEEEEEEEGQVIFSEEVLEEEDIEEEPEPQESEHDGSSVTSTMRLTRSRVEAEAEEDSSVSETRIRKGGSKAEDIVEFPTKETKKKAELALLEPSYAKKITDFDSHKMRKNHMKNLPRGRGRRSIMKKFWRPGKSVKPGHWCGIVNAITINNSFFQTGDVVSVRSQDGQIYFLQLQLIMMDRREFEGYGKMFWLTPKPGFTGPRFPFHPKNYDIRRDEPPLMASLDTVAHVAHCPLDYFDGHSSYWQPEAGTVYQSYGDPLVKWVPFKNEKVEEQSEPVTEETEEPAADSAETQVDDPMEEVAESVTEASVGMPMETSSRTELLNA